MQITVTELFVLMDTLSGTLDITDNGHLFKYAKTTRQELWEKLHVRFNQLIIDMKIEGEQHEP